MHVGEAAPPNTEKVELSLIGIKKKRITKQAAAGFLFLWWAPGLIHAQDSMPVPAPTPPVISPEAQLKKASQPPDDFAGLAYTAEQKAKIDQIRQMAKQRLDAVNKDEKLAPEAKAAMLDGYQRMELREMFEVLTPEQKAEVRRKAQARRAAQQLAQQQTKQNKPSTPQ